MKIAFPQLNVVIKIIITILIAIFIYHIIFYPLKLSVGMINNIIYRNVFSERFSINIEMFIIKSLRIIITILLPLCIYKNILPKSANRAFDSTNYKYIKFIRIFNYMLLVPWAFVSIFLPMAFDSPGSENNIYVWLFVISILIYPLIIITFHVLSTFYKNKKKDILMKITVLIPTVYALMYFPTLYIVSLLTEYYN